MDDRLDIIRRRILADRESVGSRSLADYAALFPGEDALVAQAYAERTRALAPHPRLPQTKTRSATTGS